MLNIGDQIILESTYAEKLEFYKCKVVEKKADNFYVDYPIHMDTNRTVYLVDGTQLKVTFVTKDGNVFLFESEVVGRIKQDIPMIMLNYPGKDQLLKIQRRQFVRIETSVDVAVHAIDDEFDPFTTTTFDISAGGAALVIPKALPFKRGMFISTWFILPMQNGDYHYITIKSKVVRMVDLHNEYKKISVQFVETSPKERQLLLRFTFDRQLAMKKKGIEPN
ncbi:flagellar brake protein [Bacillus sp. 03113]|uniref:flagellar brake protein n=1 Tax=Bacillus sp. 03113 TaxID=2578211 RepID=UPI0011422785|nr:flagellar brake domain-containing protein [Bacillus sp. 03113]